jgi:hypothetical protein
MTAAELLLADLRSRGIELDTDGGRLRWRPAHMVTAAQAQRIQFHKAELLTLLTGVPTSATTVHDGEMFELVAWFGDHQDRLPHEPYDLAPAVKVVDPARFYTALARDIAAGPRAARARTGVLTEELRRLRDLIGANPRKPCYGYRLRRGCLGAGQAPRE